ncbi:MAG: Glutamate--methylamine ligase [Alphaproteobacteria bacterium MarineAlpha10_Bin1]|nr:MAG: Glutamate--methylamine ligase [Alphaproteobacteria bacterium MarineAlpha10_Bin1]
MTDLENYLSEPSRDDRIRQVRQKIEELDVDYIYYQYVSITGRIMGKAIPASHWERVAAEGMQTWLGGVTNVFADRAGNLIGFPPNASELLALPDPETFCQLPWNKRLARVFCTVFWCREDPDRPEQYLDSDCRGNLRLIHQEFQDKHGLQMRSGVEPEMMWLKRGEDGKSDGGVTKPNCYHIDQFEELRPIFMRVIEYCQAMGFDMIQGDHEDAPGQLELNFMFDDALRTADRLTTYRQICAQVAREFNVIACFMTKPFVGVSASGCHHNLSLWRGGEDQLNELHQSPPAAMDDVFSYAKGGENMFMPDPAIDKRKPGPIGLNCIAGVMEHIQALTSIGSSTVNSYRRLWDTGFWAPVFADWGYQNRTCGLRISAPGRFEYRSVDSMVNPYLLGAAVLKAFDDGINRNLDPGEPEERNIYEAMEAGKQVTRLPMTLGAALDALAADEVIKSAMPDEMYRVFEHYKRDEWARFNATVTDWDLDTYMDCLP